MSAQRHVAIRVTGRVQGVFFRALTKDMADQLGLKGFIRNEPDGSVFLEAEGESESVDKLIAWVTAGGPPRGRVETIKVKEGEPMGYSQFAISR